MKALIICSIAAFTFTIQNFSQWLPLVTGTTADLQDICFVDPGTGVSAGSGGVIIRTSNSGANWTLIPPQTSQNIFTLCFPSVITGYASGYTGFIIKTSNSGQSWFSAQPCGINVRSISFINTSTGITGGGGNLMCYTTNGGSGWSPRYTPTSHAVSGLHFFSASLLVVCATDMPGAVLHKSTNSGTNWSTVMTLNNSGLNITYSLSSVYFKDANTGFATGSYQFNSQTWGRIYRSTNAGDNWEQVANIGPGSTNAMFNIHFGDNNCGFAVGNSGVIARTTNGGANWETQTSGTTVSLNSVFMQNALTGYICGAGGLILKTTNGGVVGLEPVNDEIPEKYCLYQNYPNPFNPATKIRFSIPFSSGELVSLKVIDVLGKELTTLVNEELQPGTYETEWDASNYPSGVYYYKLALAGFTDTKKMVLVK